jgi:coenzyme F420-0:L-glutamate ligase / coenzyme F420-1:gamma-L-glutamate ligase
VTRLTITPLQGLPRIAPGDKLSPLLVSALNANQIAPVENDILVIAQKIVSKSDGQIRRLDTVKPSAEADRLAKKTGKDPRLVQLILDESVEIISVGDTVIIAQHHSGHIMANAGVDQSNVDAECALLLPKNADASARTICADLSAHFGVRLGLIIADSWGRPWRLGSVGMALGTAAVVPLEDLRGRLDLNGRPLQVSQIAAADSLAAAAVLAMGEADEGTPVAHVRGWHVCETAAGADALLRPRATDLFRRH